MEASEEVVKEVNENEDGDAVLDLSNLDGTDGETLSSDDLNDEKGANEPSLILSSPQGFELKQTDIEYNLQPKTSNWTHYLLTIHP